jgi:hypothetical protein
VFSDPSRDLNTIELIVSEAGVVERVQLVSTPKRMADMMLPSSAKNWEFVPALKDGRPVRYRLELSLGRDPPDDFRRCRSSSAAQGANA